MDTTELHDYFRTQVFDVAEPYLWSDDEIYRYMNDAHEMFCRLTDGISDVSSPITTLEIITGAVTAPVSRKILKFREAWRMSDGRPLKILNQENMQGHVQHDYGWQNVTSFMNPVPGPVTIMIIGMQEDLVRWNHIPQGNDVVQLSVFRMPLYKIVGEDQRFEIDERHHLALVEWMAYRAYSKKDAETFDKTKAQEAEANFRKYCDQAHKERELQRHHTRTVAYGGY